MYEQHQFFVVAFCLFVFHIYLQKRDLFGIFMYFSKNAFPAHQKNSIRYLGKCLRPDKPS